jgi:hypothetical protein
MRVRLRVGNAMGTAALLLAETGGNQARAPLLVPSESGCPDRRFAVSKENYSTDAARRRRHRPLHDRRALAVELGLFITRFDRRGAGNAGDAIVRPDPAASSWWVSDSLVGSQARAARLGGRERLAVAGRLGDPARS